MSNRVTIKDVAREAEVSIKTVSNVLNNCGSMRPATRQRVEEAMKRLGYTLNVSARAMKTGGTRLIGLGIFDFSQPFAPYLADIIIDYARQREYGVIINTYGSAGQGIPTIVNDTYRLGADGWLFFTDRPLGSEGAVLEQPYPVVLAGDYLSYGKSDLVTMSNVAAVSDTTGHLLDAGLRRIALLGAPHDCGENLPLSLKDMDESTKRAILTASEGTQHLRMQGYVKAFERRGLQVDWSTVIFAPFWNQSGGVRAARELLDSGAQPEAIICLNDAMAFGAMHELQRRGLRVPEDVQVVGFDNVPEGEFSTPALTTIDPHVEDYARHAVDMLIERIEGYDGPTRTYTTDFELVERASTSL
ncbi:LacI family DNA-binding transcriptional regulator [Bifidobacterium panos]|uniref:LacI family transcriptional regulator n=1 Tax=Bifidobacterium panos TaxID=2675321 RepID=A0ABX1SX67_9BIFI|nr:LacI family DNA-binding transcriptional regulator [Bifidobacterium sp. DSM 109963]NMN02430.1 LacI family transcriptional regulator [Bifidobacterium sp. DSM 109963]